MLVLAWIGLIIVCLRCVGDLYQTFCAKEISARIVNFLGLIVGCLIVYFFINYIFIK